MKQIISILILTLLFSSCREQEKHFSPVDIIDLTEKCKNGNWTKLNNKEKIDGYTRIGDSIFGGEISCYVKPLHAIDVNSFKVLPGTKYAKDTNHVYYPLEILCIDYSDCDVCYYKKVIVKEANPMTFKYLGKDYATDGQNVYFRGEQIPGADGKTFKVIDGPDFFYFAVDKNTVYKHNKIFPLADPLTFYYAKNDKRNVDTEYIHNYIIADKNNKWKFIPPNTINEIDEKDTPGE